MLRRSVFGLGLEFYWFSKDWIVSWIRVLQSFPFGKTVWIWILVLVVRRIWTEFLVGRMDIGWFSRILLIKGEADRYWILFFGLSKELDKIGLVGLDIG